MRLEDEEMKGFRGMGTAAKMACAPAAHRFHAGGRVTVASPSTR